MIAAPDFASSHLGSGSGLWQKSALPRPVILASLAVHVMRQGNRAQSYSRLYYTILYYTILYYTILYYIILYYTILYYTILHYTTLYSTTLYSTLLYSLLYSLLFTFRAVTLAPARFFLKLWDMRFIADTLIPRVAHGCCPKIRLATRRGTPKHMAQTAVAGRGAKA